jgi:hypothetical protein
VRGPEGGNNKIGYKLHLIRDLTFTVAKMSMLLFWVITPCGLESFGETYSLATVLKPRRPTSVYENEVLTNVLNDAIWVSKS